MGGLQLRIDGEWFDFSANQAGPGGGNSKHSFLKESMADIALVFLTENVARVGPGDGRRRRLPRSAPAQSFLDANLCGVPDPSGPADPSTAGLPARPQREHCCTQSVGHRGTTLCGHVPYENGWMLDPGTRIGGYTLVEHVGDEGTMADVYRAVDEAGRTVAMKLLRTASERGRREAALAPQLDHPDIVRTFDVIEWEGRRCLIQEWIEGQSLRTVLDSQRHLDLAETIKMGRAVASALAYAHARNILHRDIKPSNVLRTVAGRYKLVDFGAVGLLDPATSQTRAGEIAGTPLYMSPEQIAGGSQTAASDIYGLGLLLFECFHGTLPGGSSPDFMQLIFARVNAPIDVPPSPLKALLDHCLDRDPAMRPQSAAEVRDALSRIMSGPTEAAEPVPTSAVEPVSIPDVVAVEGSPRSEPASRSVGLGALTGILVGVGGLVLLWLLAPDPGDVWSWLRLGAGVVIVGVALLAARWVRQLASRSPEAERQAAGILAGASDRDALTRSMVIQVDHVVARLKGIDAKVLGLTMVMLIREAEEARNSADRVAALMQIVALMEKLMRRLSPWYVRHKEGIATGIAIVGSLVGVASAVSGFLG